MNWFTVWSENFPALLDGLKISLLLTFAALAIGIPLGLLLAIGSSSKIWPVKAVCVAIVEIGRGTPALIVLYVVYFGLPDIGLTLTAFVCAVISLAFTTGGYTCEYIRSGLNSVPKGTIEAAEGLAMNNRDKYRYIIIPQGLRIAIPGLMGFAIQLFQATSLVKSITIRDLTGVAWSIGLLSSPLAIITLAGIMYAAITIPTTVLMNRVERRMSLRH